MRRLWVAAVVLLLAGCGTATARTGPAAQAGSGAAEAPSSTSRHPVPPAHSATPGPAASGHRSTGVPDPADWEAMSRAVYTSPLTSSVPDSEYVVVGLQLAGSHGQWAGGMTEPREKGAVQPVAVLLHRVRGRWKLVDLGTAMVGCGIAPRPVLEQLRFFDVRPHC